MRIIEIDDLEDVSDSTRKAIVKIVKQCHTCQLKQGKPSRLHSSIRDQVIEDFNHVLQLDLMAVIHSSIRHVTDIGMGFQNGVFISKMDADKAWLTLQMFRTNVYAGAPENI